MPKISALLLGLFLLLTGAGVFAQSAQTVAAAKKEGGKVVMDFAETFWSPGYGSLVDRFGVPWMVNTLPAADANPV